MKTEHPITPPPGLIKNWCASRIHEKQDVPLHVHIAIQAARWGADEELKACLKWMGDRSSLTESLRAARRPKPPSLKEQALAELELLRGDANAHGLGFDAPAIRRALEALPDV